MGNSNASATKSSTNGDVQKVGDGGESIPALNGNGTVGKQQKTSTVVNKDEEFIVHGIDYLPEFEKRNERRKKNVPKILRIDSINWTANYLHFFSRNNHGSRTTVQSDKSSTTGHDDKTLSNGDITLQNRHISRSGTVDIIVDENANDWVSHPDYPFENIVMSGGGSKGYAYIGSLKALEDCGILKGVKRIAGSSAGAICAGLLAVGCSPQEIADVFKCDIKWLFHDQTCTCCCCIPRVCNKYGIHPAKRFHEIYGEHIARKVGSPDVTFKQLQDRYGRELCIVVTNLSRMCSEYCTPSTCPDLPIRDAVRMSMAFPVVFRAVRYNLTGRECLYTDGGLLDQYPIHCFDEPEVEVNHNKQLSDSMDECNEKTLGLYVVSEKPIDYKIWQTLFGKEIPYKPTYLPNTRLARARLKHELSNRKRQNKHFSKKDYMDELRASVGDNALEMWDHYEVLNKSHVDISNFGDYFVTAIETLLISQRRLHVKPNDAKRTVAINCGYIGTNDYVIEPGDREFMINQGYTCTRRFLQEYLCEVRTPTRLRQSASCGLMLANHINGDAHSLQNRTFYSSNSQSLPNFANGITSISHSGSQNVLPLLETQV